MYVKYLNNETALTPSLPETCSTTLHVAPLAEASPNITTKPILKDDIHIQLPEHPQLVRIRPEVPVTVETRDTANLCYAFDPRVRSRYLQLGIRACLRYI
jgi:hypothetical protein